MRSNRYRLRAACAKATIATSDNGKRVELLGAGEEVVVLDDLSTGFRWLLPDDIAFAQGNMGARRSRKGHGWWT